METTTPSRLPAVLEPAREVMFEDVEVYARGVVQPVDIGRSLTIQEQTPNRWVGSIDADLSAYGTAQLDLVIRTEQEPLRVPVTVGPRIRGESLVIGVEPLDSDTHSPAIPGNVLRELRSV